jgi:cytidylate kinase
LIETSTTEKYAVNVALSGWSGVGTTTLTLILALLLKRNYIYIGSVFRFLNEALNKAGDPALSAEFEQFIQPQVGKTLDNYIDYKLLNSNNVIVESDLSTFRIGKHPKVYSIFIKSSEAMREKRTKKDKRKDEAPIAERDRALREEYLKLWNIDVFDTELIARKYNLIIDNSELSVEQEVTAVLQKLQEQPRFADDYNWKRILKSVTRVLKLYQSKGKDKLREELRKKGLVLQPQQIMTEIVQVFPEDVKLFAPQVQKLFLGQ